MGGPQKIWDAGLDEGGVPHPPHIGQPWTVTLQTASTIRIFVVCSLSFLALVRAIIFQNLILRSTFLIGFATSVCTGALICT